MSREFYICFELDAASRALVLESFPPRHRHVAAHHITHYFGVDEDAALPKQPENIHVVGYHETANMQVLAVEIDGQNKMEDNGVERFYHITLSLNRHEGVTPAQSNDLLNSIARRKGESALRNLDTPIKINAAPVLKERIRQQQPKRRKPARAPGMN